jgi:hypothetical protein
MKSIEVRAKKVELCGLILILASTFFQLFISAPARDNADSSVVFKLEEKMDVIYQISKANFQKLYYKASDSSYNPELDSKLFYKYAEMNKNQQHVKGQSNFIGIMVGLVFLFGSLLICYAKYLEYISCKREK